MRRVLAGGLPALALVALGLAAAYEASSLALGTVRQPGSGFYPTLVCALLVVFGGLALADPSRSPPDAVAGDVGGQARVWIVVSALAAYALALNSVGFVPCTIALLVLMLRGIGRVSWAVAIATAGVGAIVCYMAFSRLGLPLPAGLLAF